MREYFMTLRLSYQIVFWIKLFQDYVNSGSNMNIFKKVFMYTTAIISILLTLMELIFYLAIYFYLKMVNINIFEAGLLQPSVIQTRNRVNAISLSGVTVVRVINTGFPRYPWGLRSGKVFDRDSKNTILSLKKDK